MATFEITAPTGKKYRVTGENAEGAYAALMQHLGTGAAPKSDFDGSDYTFPSPPDDPLVPDAKPQETTGAGEEDVGIKLPGTVDAPAKPALPAKPAPLVTPGADAPPVLADPLMSAMTDPTDDPTTEPMIVAINKRLADPNITPDMRAMLEDRLRGIMEKRPEEGRRLVPTAEATRRTAALLDPHAAKAEPTAPDPFAGEGAAALLKRRGQQFAKGATEIFATIPEAVAIMGASADRRDVLSADYTDAMADKVGGDMRAIETRMAEIEATLGFNGKPRPKIAREDRAAFEEARPGLEAEYLALSEAMGQKRAATGAGGVEAMRAEAAAERAGGVDPVTGKLVPAKDRPMFAYGDKLREASANTFGAPDARDTGFWGKVAEGSGSVAAFATSALVPGGVVAKTVTGAALGSETNMASMYSEAIAAGADEETAQRAAKWGALIGAGEIIPINRALKILPRSWGPKIANLVMKGFVEIAESSGEEAAQEWLSQVANNWVAKGLYDPERGWMEGANENALIGAITGGALSAVGVARGDPESAREPVVAPKRRDEVVPAPQDELAAAMGGAPAVPPAAKPAEKPVDKKAAAVAALKDFAAKSQGAGMVPGSEPARYFDKIVADAEKAGMTSDEIDAALTVEKAPPLVLTPKDAAPAAAPVAPVAPEPPKVAPKEAAVAPKDETTPPADFEIMDEVETVDGEERPTGRKVRVNLNTGDAEVVEDGDTGAEVGGDGVGGRGAPEETQAVAAKAETPPADLPKPAPETAPDPEFVGDRPPPVRKFLTHDETLAIKTNPKVFQYKGGADTEGVTDALRNIKGFDPNRAGQLVLFERLDGTLEVADGHQRTGLARRAAEGGQADVGGAAATIYREADGYTAEEVMGLAALKNIGEGSGSAVDAARILRTRSESIADLGLPPNSALVRKAEGIRRLGDDAFGMVANGVASEEHGDVVGRNVPDKALQADILAMLTREKPDNLAQAAMIARDAASTATTETQTDMFGTLQVQKSLYVERAKVLDAAMKSQGIMAKTFRNLIDREGMITAAGNKLDAESNAALVDEAGKIRQYLQSQANMKGPISDALTKAAEAVRSGTPVARAADGFVKDVKSALQGGGTGSAPPAGGRAPDEGKPEDQPEAVAPTPGADLFGAMMGTEKPAASPPATKTPSDDLFAAMGGDPAQTGKTPDQVRAEAEAKVKAAESKKGTTKPQVDAGPLFDDQADIEKPKPAAPVDLIARGRETLKPYWKPEDQGYNNQSGIDLRKDPMVVALAARMAKAKTAQEREKLADDFVLEQGMKDMTEYLVVLGKGGEILAVMKGSRSNVSLHAAVWRAIDDGKAGYATHNHPGSGDFSGNDLMIVGMGVRVVAMAHDGRRHVAEPVSGAIPKTSLIAGDVKPFLKATSILTQLRDEVWVAAEPLTAAWDLTGKAARLAILHRGAFSLILDRLGVIKYSGATVDDAAAVGLDFGELYGRASSTFSDRLGRAGFKLTESRDQSGDRPADSGAGTARPAADGADQGTALPDGQGDGSGRVPETVTPPDDFDSAADDVLNDIFGTTPAKKPTKRSDADIAKDLGGLFNEDPAEYLSPMDRAKAKAKKRPAQRDMFDLMDAAAPGERQTDLEDLIQDLKDRDRDLFGFGEDVISTEKYAKAVPLFREILAGQDVTAQPVSDTIRAVAVRFKDNGLTRDGIERMLPYLKLYLADVRDGKLTNPVEDGNAPSPDSNLEPDRGDATSGDRLGQDGLPAAAGGPGGRGGRGGNAPDAGNGQRDGGDGLPAGDAASVGTQGNPPVQGGIRGKPGAAVDRDGAGSRDRGEQRPAPDSQPATHTEQYAVDTAPDAVASRQAQQAEADKKTKAQGVKWADEASVRQSLPLLKPEQQDDVIKIEKRFAKPNGHGMLLTNGTGTGKAQPLDAGVLTPTGWRRMGDLAVGDQVIAADGHPTSVTGVFPQGEKPIYRVLFSDGASTECCDEHLWETQTLYERRKARTNPAWACAMPKVRSLSDIRQTLGDQHFVPVAPAVQHPARPLPVRPYTLGVILGDGCIRQSAITVSSQDEQLADALALDLDDDFRVVRTGETRCPTWRISDDQPVKAAVGRFGGHRMTAALRNMGLMGAGSAEKFIPPDYLTSSIADRTDLLQGLMDTDGTVDRRTGSVSFCTVSSGLANGITALVRSLGGTASRSTARKFYTHNGKRREGQIAHIITMHLPNEIAPFRLSRKAALVRPKAHAPRRKIVAVEAVGVKPAQCIAVAHSRRLYITDDYVLTHNTYSGGGVVKRFVQQGKTNILIVAPSQGILDHWERALADMGIEASRLDDTKSSGKGVTLTTYANMGENETLADRDWDLVVTDEAHKLSQNADGDATAALQTLRAITNRPADRQKASMMRRRAEWAKAQAMPDSDIKTNALNRLWALARQDAEAMATKPRAKVLFLSATPFAYVKNTDYAEGYLFDYPADGHVGHSRQPGRNLFMVENFGYRIRYHKLTQPDVGVDTGVFEREFHEKMRREGVLSGRMLDIDADYDRLFVMSESAEGVKIDEILQFISDQANAKGDDQRSKEYRALRDSMKSTFNHLKQMQLLEAIKADKAVKDIEAHLKLGRKVVVFHDYNVGGGFNPFRPDISSGVIPTAEAYAGYARLLQDRPEVEKLDFEGLLPPVEALKKRFGDRAVIYNGTIPQKVRKQGKADFQTDGSGIDVIIVQSAAGEAGIDLHDITGGHQRALVNLGMPVRPTTALQEEGRIRREGSVTDAAFRYYTIGTAWERRAFAAKIAERSGTVENLALGNQARTIRDSFIDSYGDAEPIQPEVGDGKGGKVKDRAQASASPYDVAKTHYYGRMKTTGRRDQRDGLDFYPTPEPLAFKMVEWAGIRAYERALEPSAGDGSIARYLPEHARRTIIEPSMELLSKAELRASGSTAINRTFEDYHIANKHHAIVMNPPFGSGGKTAYEHLQKAMEHLKPGGRIVALVPTGPAADKRWEDMKMGGYSVSTIILPAVTFEKAGTSVRSRIIILDKALLRQDGKPDLESVAKQDALAGYTDISGITTIESLFDRLQNMTVSPRVEQRFDPTEEVDLEVDEDGEPIEQPIQMTPPPAKLTKPIADSLGGFKLAQTKHALKGFDLFVATAENRVEKDAYNAALSVAKQHGGWYSAFRGNGAIPGFQFKTEAERQAFLDDMGKPVIGLEETAYHGTPHQFDRFSLDKIGTGEGAQVYGWGLYFAGRRDVAEYYRNKLTVPQLMIEGDIAPSFFFGDLSSKTIGQVEALLAEKPAAKPAEISADDWRNAKTLLPITLFRTFNNLRDKVIYSPSDDPKKRLAIYRETALARYQANVADARVHDAMERASELAAIDWLADRASVQGSGSLFKVEVPEKEDLLDWGAPISKHSPQVQEQLAPVIDAIRRYYSGSREKALNGGLDGFIKRLTGREVLEFLQTNGPTYGFEPDGFEFTKGGGGNVVMHQVRDAATGEVLGEADMRRNALGKAGIRADRYAALALKKLGIPGHRFLDQGSRDGGEGTYNYVIYDEAKIQITGLEEAETPAFKAWFGDSKVVDAGGKPKVVYHGTRNEFEAFKPGSFFTESRDLAEGYGEGETQRIVPAFLSIKKPATGADVIRVAEGLPGWDSDYQDEYPGIIFNQVPGVMEALQKEGFDGASFDDGPGGMSDADDAPTWVAFSPTQIKATDNTGAFDPADPRIRYQSPRLPSVQSIIDEVDQKAAALKVGEIKRALKAELERLGLKRVRLGFKNGVDWQGMFLREVDGSMFVLIGAAHDPMATLHHEVIHVMKEMNLFTEAEWTALERAAARWMDKHDIPARYPSLTYEQQLEEAIAEEFAESFAKKQAPRGSILITAFNKIIRLFKAIRNAAQGLGFQSAEDIFGRALSGEISARQKAWDRAPAPDRGAAMVKADAFKRWFGKSKVVDAAGKPLQVYHGTKFDGDISIFLPMTHFGTARAAGQRINHKERFIPEAKASGERLYPVYLSMEKPLEMGREQGFGDNGEWVDDSDMIRQIGKTLGRKGETMAAERLGALAEDVYKERTTPIAARTQTAEILAELGYDGLTYTNIVEDSSSVSYVPLRGEQVKSTFNRGTFDPADPRISYQKARLPSKQARAHMATPMGGQHLHIPDRNIWQELSRAGAPIWQRLRGGAGAARDAVDRARVVIQDRMLPLRRAQFEIEKLRGSPLPSAMDAYTVETTFSGKVGRHLFEIDEDFTKPIVTLIAQTKGRLTAESVGTWLYARHAIERNARIASINPRMPDGGSGMMDADAQAILAAAAASPDAAALDKIGTLVDQLRERSLILRQNKGLITATEANRWRTQYKHYVPLKGWADTDLSDSMLDVSGVGRRFNTRGQESRMALGRSSEAFNPLQAIITQAQEVAIRAEKNAVGQAVIELAKAHPSPALWSIKQIKMKQVFNRTTGLVEMRPEDPLTLFMEPNEMAVKVSGQEYRITFHDPRLARALGQVGADQMNGVMRFLSMMSRFFSMTRTTLNPEFMIPNAFRDFQTAQFGIQAFGINPKTKADDRAAIAAAMAANWRKALAGVYRGLGNKADTTWSKYFKEFQQAGANISFWNMDQPEAGIRDLDKRISLARGSRAARMLKHLRPSAVFNMRDNPALAFIERANLAVDNAIRLAAFIKARELGWEVQDAAFLAKELTVNFNRRGETTSSVNALYPFFNAAIQGSVRVGKALVSRRVAIMATVAVGAGVVLDLVNAGLSDEDDDGELFYDKIPEYRNERNLHFVLGGTGDNPVAMPMPYGFNIFPYAGQQIGKWLRGVQDPEESFGNVMVAAFGAFSPVSGGTPETMVAPFFADPFVEMAQNENFAGNTIYPAYPKTGTPDSQTFYPSATLTSRWAAETLNAVTGGDFRQPGMIDVSPETMDHLSAYVFGSAGAFWGRTTDVMGKVMSGNTDQIEQQDIPFLRTVTTPITKWVDLDRYRQFSLDVKDANADAKAYVEAGMPVPPEVQAKANLYEAYLAAERELDGKGEWNQTKEGALTPRDERAVWLDFNRKYLKVTRPKVEQ